LGSALANCCRAGGRSLAMLPESFDVDEEQDILHLITALKADQRPGRQALYRLTCSMVSVGASGHAKP
jgi:hypothetical protein